MLSNELVFVTVTLPPGGYFRSSDQHRAFFDTHECLYVLQGEYTCQNPETGETKVVRQGEMLFMPEKCWLYGYNFGSTELRLLECIAPPTNQAALAHLPRPKAVKAFEPSVFADFRMPNSDPARFNLCNSDNAISTVLGDANPVRFRVLASTERVFLSEITLRPNGHSDVMRFPFDVCYHGLQATAHIHAFDSGEYLPLEANDVVYLPADTPHRLFNHTGSSLQLLSGGAGSFGARFNRLNPMDLFDISGRAYVVTGGGHGLGRAMALELARRGGRIAVCARTQSEIDAVAHEIVEAGGDAIAIAFDAADSGACQRMIEAACQQFGSLDGLVLSHGIGHGKAILELGDAEFETVMQVNLNGSLACIQAFGRHAIAEHRKGSIVLVSSTAAVSTFTNLTAYGTSKSAATQLMRQVAVEWGRHGIRANAVAPGYMNHMMKGTADRYTGSYVDEWVDRMTPMRRRGDTGELLGAVVYFLSDASSFTTGQVLAIDGGYTVV